MEPFISITWTQDVEDDEARVLVYTVTHLVAQVGKRMPFWFQFQTLPSIRPFGDWVILRMPRGSAYSSVDWYLQHSRTSDGGRVDGAAYLQLVEMEPWQSATPHFDVTLVAEDLRDARGQSVLSLARTGLAAVASVYHLRQVAGEQDRIARLGSLVAHILGRAVGIPLTRRSSGVVQEGDDTFCANPCAMQPVASPGVLAAWDAEATRGWGYYCDACQSDLGAVFVGAHYGLN